VATFMRKILMMGTTQDETAPEIKMEFDRQSKDVMCSLLICAQGEQHLSDI